jgi:hypothetical protein
MAGTKNSISSLLAQFLRLQKNSLEIINKLSNATTSKEETVSVEFLDDNNQASTVSIPSWGYIINEIKRLDDNIKALSGLDDNNANVRNADGTFSKIFQTKPLIDPPAPANLQVPSNFKYRSNYFFESFLNPLLYVSFNLDGQVDPGTKRVYIKRIIANISNDVQRNYFDTNLKGRNDISDIDFMTELTNNNITYFVDESPEDVPLQIVRYKGTFSVLRVFDVTVPVTTGGQTINQKVRKYKLDGITYKDTISSLSNGDRQLKIGDRLITPGGSKFEVKNVDVSEYTVVLKRISGYEPVPIGEGVLSLDSEILSPLQINVNIGHDERQGVFIKAINDDYHVTGTSYSNGVVFYSNEVTINTSEGVMDLDTFYKNYVSDFGSQFVAGVKEKIVPSVYGVIPNTPVLSTNNFKVVQINKQITDTKTSEKFSATVQNKVKVQNEIDSINKSIDQTRSELANIVSTSVTSTTQSSRQSLISKIDSLTKEKSTKTSLLQTIIQDLNNISSAAPEVKESPKYRIRGFWPLPAPINDSKTGTQDVIQFRVRYRYLTQQGNSTGTEEIKFSDNDGTERRAAFSNWIEYKTDIRKKSYDSNTKKYFWLDEDVQNSDAPNINQLDIPITAGERVELKVSSISEAGWPLNPMESDFSAPIVIEFPQELVTSNPNSEYIKQNEKDQILVSLQQDLTARGLDTHLSTAFNTGDKYFAHIAETISSGFFDTTGKTLDLYQKLLAMDQEIASLRALITVAKGVLTVYIKDGNNFIQAKRGSFIELFAGYYNEILDLSNPSNYGKIVTVNYNIELRNETASPLELASIIPGGQNVLAPDSQTTTNNDDYKNNRKYDLTPISLTSIKSTSVDPALPASGNQEDRRKSFVQAAPFQSGNTNSQFIYPRYRSVGLDADLYFGVDLAISPNVNYASGVGSDNIPADRGTLFPYDPDATTLGQVNPNIWNGAYLPLVSKPSPGGRLNEFCIHRSHPALKNSITWQQLTRPDNSNLTIQNGGRKYPEIRHADGFYVSTLDTSFDPNINFQTKNYQQLEYISISSDKSFSSSSNYAHPHKLGFSSNDEFLVGKYTCGSYLYLAPSNHDSIQVEGSTVLAVKSLRPGTQNNIVIPLVFQMRCLDKLGFVGGYRRSGTIRNITYAKRIGIDIKIKDEELFSFDVQISGSYGKSALVSPTYSNNMDLRGLLRDSNP